MLPVAQHMVGNYTSAHTNSCDICKFLKRVLFCLTQIDFGLHLCKKAKEVVYKKKTCHEIFENFSFEYSSSSVLYIEQNLPCVFYPVVLMVYARVTTQKSSEE